MSTTDQRNRRALGLLTGLFDEAKQRPGCWEAAHVEALEAELGEVIDALTGADGGDYDQDDAGTVADAIRSAAGSWRLCAVTLADGNVDQALQHAALAEFGTEGLRGRIAALAVDA